MSDAYFFMYLFFGGNLLSPPPCPTLFRPPLCLVISHFSLELKQETIIVIIKVSSSYYCMPLWLHCLKDSVPLFFVFIHSRINIFHSLINLFKTKEVSLFSLGISNQILYPIQVSRVLIFHYQFSFCMFHFCCFLTFLICARCLLTVV